MFARLKAKLPKTELGNFLIARYFSSFASGSFMCIFAVLFIQAPFSFSAKQLSLLVLIAAITERGISFLYPFIAPAFHLNRAMMFGLLLRFTALSALILSPNFPTACCTFFFYGLGSLISDMNARYWLVISNSPEERIQRLSASYRTINAAVACGSILIFYLPYQSHPRLVLLAVAVVFLLATAVLKYRFPIVPPSTHSKTLRFTPKAYWQELKTHPTVGFYLLGLFFMSWCMCSMGLVAYSFELTSGVPSSLGWYFALNPLIITFFQKKWSQYFFRLEKKQDSLGFVFSFVFMTLGFLAPALHFSELNVLWFILWLTVAEMLILPHIDYFISSSSVSDQLKALLFASTGTIFALARLNEALGLIAIDYLQRKHHSISWWWALNFIGFFALSMWSVWRLKKLKRVNIENRLETAA